MSTYGYLQHHGILGQKWGIRRYQNPDGSLTEEGRKRYGYGSYQKGNDPQKTLDELKKIHEAEKQGNLKGVYDKYFSKDEEASAISKASLKNAALGKVLDNETDKAFQNTFGDKTFVKDSIAELAKNVAEENHPEGGGGKNIYSDDLYDYLVEAYANVLKKRNPKLDELEKKYKDSEKSYNKELEDYVDKIVGDLASEIVYTENVFGFERQPRFIFEVQNLISSANMHEGNYYEYLHHGTVKNYIDMNHLADDDLYNYSREIEEALKEKGIRVIW